jgi:hypothetical protein
MASVHVIKANGIRPLGKTVLATGLERGPQKSSGGIIIPDDNMTAQGIRERWAQVYAVGPKVVGIEPGEWVLVSHGRWTLGFELETPEGKVRLWALDYPDGILMASDQPPSDRSAASLDIFRRVA